MPEITTALRWNLLRGASFKRSLTVVAPARPVAGTGMVSVSAPLAAAAEPVASEMLTPSSVPLVPTCELDERR
jgi:hypothetical protein